ncbi:MAG: hypothetical protein LBT45_02395 [Rickettsiales bacterium]|nr:hypothetical protein [Rickettsiales bacterium]
MAEKVEVKNEGLSPLKVEVEKSATGAMVGAIKAGIDFAIRVGIMVGIYKAVDAINRLAPYLKQMAENGGR